MKIGRSLVLRVVSVVKIALSRRSITKQMFAQFQCHRGSRQMSMNGRWQAEVSYGRIFGRINKNGQHNRLGERMISENNRRESLSLWLSLFVLSFPMDVPRYR